MKGLGGEQEFEFRVPLCSGIPKGQFVVQMASLGSCIQPLDTFLARDRSRTRNAVHRTWDQVGQIANCMINIG